MEVNISRYDIQIGRDPVYIPGYLMSHIMSIQRYNIEKRHCPFVIHPNPFSAGPYGISTQRYPITIRPYQFFVGRREGQPPPRFRKCCISPRPGRQKSFTLKGMLDLESLENSGFVREWPNQASWTRAQKNQRLVCSCFSQRCADIHDIQYARYLAIYVHIGKSKT